MNYEESAIQIAFVEWAGKQYPKFSTFIIHVPNGEDRPKRKNKKGKWYCPSGVRLKKMGTKPGAADILFMWRKKYFGGLWLEFKSSIGKQTNSQKEFEELCRIAQYDYQVVHNLDEAIIVFKRYMNLEEAAKNE